MPREAVSPSPGNASKPCRAPSTSLWLGHVSSKKTMEINPEERQAQPVELFPRRAREWLAKWDPGMAASGPCG